MMAPAVPRFLFRASSEKSNGINRRGRFAPELVKRGTSQATDPNVDPNRMLYHPSQGRLKDQLAIALNEKQAPWNPIVFFSSSVLVSIQHGYNKHTKGKFDVLIECVDTWTAKSENGDPVRFRSMRNLHDELGMQILKARWTRKELFYADVFVTTDEVHAGQGASSISLRTLQDQGLENLLPEFGAVVEVCPHNPGLETPTSNLRDYWFRSKKDLEYEEIDLAARLAAAFEPVHVVDPSQRHNRLVDLHIFSWFLTCKNQDENGARLQWWLYLHAKSMTSGECTADMTALTGVPEVDRYNAIYDVVSQRDLRVDDIRHLHPCIPPEQVEMQRDLFLQEYYSTWRSRRRKEQAKIARDRKITKGARKGMGKRVKS